jgi:hypothetical protein
MNRIDIIQSFINKLGAKAYLEIGVQGGSCFEAIKCEKKVGVDPDESSRATVKLTSDEYFNRHNKMDARTEKEFFDVIFIDGLHHADQVEKDILNALEHLNEGGVICVHDNLPTNKFMQEIPQQPSHNEWTGNGWETWVKLRQTRSDLEMYVVNTDWGVGVIKRGTQTPVVINLPITWENYAVHSSEWSNVISVDQFKHKEGF